jgi:hypothetical protein
VGDKARCRARTAGGADACATGPPWADPLGVRFRAPSGASPARSRSARSVRRDGNGSGGITHPF